MPATNKTRLETLQRSVAHILTDLRAILGEKLTKARLVEDLEFLRRELDRALDESYRVDEEEEAGERTIPWANQEDYQHDQELTKDLLAPDLGNYYDTPRLM